MKAPASGHPAGVVNGSSLESHCSRKCPTGWKRRPAKALTSLVLPEATQAGGSTFLAPQSHSNARLSQSWRARFPALGQCS